MRHVFRNDKGETVEIDGATLNPDEIRICGVRYIRATPLTDAAEEMARVIMDMDDEMGFGDIHSPAAKAIFAIAERIRPILNVER